MINHRPLHPTMGSMIIDKRLTDFTDAEFEELKQLILRRRAVFFEKQFLSDEEMATVATKLVSKHGWFSTEEIDNAEESTFRYGFDWHSDKVFSNMIPPYTLFQMNYLPDNSKGDTEFLDAVGFFEGCFSEHMSKLFLELRAVFEMRGPQEMIRHDNGRIEFRGTWFKAIHPVILPTHLDDGTVLNSMLVNPCHTKNILDLTGPESDNIIRCIVDTMYRRSEHKYRHRWNEGDLVIWSNRVCQHRGIKDFEFGFQRKFKRIMIH